jgi:hypothetical protein
VCVRLTGFEGTRRQAAQWHNTKCARLQPSYVREQVGASARQRRVHRGAYGLLQARLIYIYVCVCVCNNICMCMCHYEQVYVYVNMYMYMYCTITGLRRHLDPCTRAGFRWETTARTRGACACALAAMRTWTGVLGSRSTLRLGWTARGSCLRTLKNSTRRVRVNYVMCVFVRERESVCVCAQGGCNVRGGGLYALY